MSQSAPTETAGVASPALDRRIEKSITKAIPVALAKFFSSGGLVTSQELSSGSGVSYSSLAQPDDEIPAPFNRGERFHATEKAVELSSELLDLTTQAFTKPLSKDRWKELCASYPPLKENDGFTRALTMEAGMKEEIRTWHGQGCLCL